MQVNLRDVAGTRPVVTAAVESRGVHAIEVADVDFVAAGLRRSLHTAITRPRCSRGHASARRARSPSSGRPSGGRRRCRPAGDDRRCGGPAAAARPDPGRASTARTRAGRTGQAAELDDGRAAGPAVTPPRRRWRPIALELDLMADSQRDASRPEGRHVGVRLPVECLADGAVTEETHERPARHLEARCATRTGAGLLDTVSHGVPFAIYAGPYR